MYFNYTIILKVPSITCEESHSLLPLIKSSVNEKEEDWPREEPNGNSQG